MKKIVLFVFVLLTLCSCTTKKEAREEMETLFPNAIITPTGLGNDANYFIIDDTITQRYLIARHYHIGGMEYYALPIKHCK
jgi:hypothetical protein